MRKAWFAMAIGVGLGMTAGVLAFAEETEVVSTLEEAEKSGLTEEEEAVPLSEMQMLCVAKSSWETTLEELSLTEEVFEQSDDLYTWHSREPMLMNNGLEGWLQISYRDTQNESPSEILWIYDSVDEEQAEQIYVSLCAVEKDITAEYGELVENPQEVLETPFPTDLPVTFRWYQTREHDRYLESVITYHYLSSEEEEGAVLVSFSQVTGGAEYRDLSEDPLLAPLDEITWGMTMEQVTAILDSQEERETDGKISSSGSSLLGQQVNLVFTFEPGEGGGFMGLSAEFIDPDREALIAELEARYGTGQEKTDEESGETTLCWESMELDALQMSVKEALYQCFLDEMKQSEERAQMYGAQSWEAWLEQPLVTITLDGNQLECFAGNLLKARECQAADSDTAAETETAAEETIVEQTAE